MESKQGTIDRLYDEGKSLPAIIAAVGTDDETLRLVGYRLGVAMSTLRREAERINLERPYDETTVEGQHLNEKIARQAWEERWLDRIERDYGVRLGAGQLYVDRGRGYVYAGSEYVARVGATDEPEDAREWTDSIGHFPRGTGRLEVAERSRFIVWQPESNVILAADLELEAACAERDRTLAGHPQVARQVEGDRVGGLADRPDTGMRTI
jgi:hypothetical protein